ncbi:MAG: hypothetical protein ABIA74_05175 [bacterium]
MNINKSNFIKIFMVIIFSLSLFQITKTQDIVEKTETTTAQNNADGVYTKTKEKTQTTKPSMVKPKNSISILTNNPKVISSMRDVTENMSESNKLFFYNHTQLIPVRIQIKNNSDTALLINNDALKYNLQVNSKKASYALGLQILRHTASQYINYFTYISALGGTGFIGYKFNDKLLNTIIDISKQSVDFSAKLVNPYMLIPAGLAIFTLNKLDSKYALTSTAINKVFGFYNHLRAEDFQPIFDIRNEFNQQQETTTIQPSGQAEILVFVTQKNKEDLWNNNIQPALNFNIQ